MYKIHIFKVIYIKNNQPTKDTIDANSRFQNKIVHFWIKLTFWNNMKHQRVRCRSLNISIVFNWNYIAFE